MEERIKKLIAELHWAILERDQMIEDLQKQIKELKDADNNRPVIIE